MKMKNKIMPLLLFLLAAVNMHAADGITVNFDVKIRCWTKWFSSIT